MRVQRIFNLQRPANLPDAFGAAHGLRDAVDGFIMQLLGRTDRVSIEAAVAKPAG